MASHSRMTVKGQVTIPKDVRDLLGLKPGQTVEFAREGERVFVQPAAQPVVDKEARRKDMLARIERARRHALPMTDMTTDEYMAMIREPVPIPDQKDV